MSLSVPLLHFSLPATLFPDSVFLSISVSPSLILSHSLTLSLSLEELTVEFP